jgi:hypothetical protein
MVVAMLVPPALAKICETRVRDLWSSDQLLWEDLLARQEDWNVGWPDGFLVYH